MAGSGTLGAMTDAFVLDRGALGRWYVLDVREKLEARRREVLAKAHAFDALQTAALRATPSRARALTRQDAMDTRHVNSRMTSADADALVARWNERSIGARLGATSARLEDQDQRADELTSIIEDLTGPNARVAKVTKTLALKRPGLVPMLDRLVYWLCPGNGLQQKIDWFQRLARVWDHVIPRSGLAPAQAIEKVLWFDGVFPWHGKQAGGTAAQLVAHDWRVVHWPSPRRRGSATLPGRGQRDGCVVWVPGTTNAGPHLPLDELARFDAKHAETIREVTSALDTAAERGDVVSDSSRARG
jgi:hypothetical protein